MRFLLLIVALSQPSVWADDRTGFAELTRGDFQAAASAFDDPFWSGIALYRAGDWARAAGQFAQSEHPLAHYNLANCYAQLGQFALALETYEQVDETLPVITDARFNAQLMTQLLAEDGDSEQKPQQTEESESQSSDEPSSQSDAGQSPDAEPEDETAPSDEASAADADESNTADAQEGAPQAVAQPEQNDPPEAQMSPNGRQSEPAPEQNQPQSDDGETMSETELQAQTVEQWLSGIQDEPARYLRARIEQSVRQRRQAGTLPEPEPLPW